MEQDGPVSFNEGAPEIAEAELEYDLNDKKSMLGEGSFGSVYKVSRKERRRKKRRRESW